MTLSAKFMEYIKRELSKFGTEDFNPGKNWWEAVRVFVFWSIPALLFVVFVKYVEAFRSASYYHDAISQGIGPKLWNVIFVFGYTFFLLSLIFCRVRWLSITAHQILGNVFAIGVLTFGLLLGQIICQIPEDREYLGSWRFYLVGSSLAIQLFVLATLNVSIWYLSYLIRWDGSFQTKISTVSMPFRLVVGGLLLLLLLWHFWIEK